MTDSHPHESLPRLTAGSPLDESRVALILVHGRGGSAEEIIAFASEILELEPGIESSIALVAPQAAGATWYPQPFLAPIEGNEPWLSSGLAVIGGAVSEIDRVGPGATRTILVGFSQGACLAMEYVARNARRYGGVAGLSGGLIGPPGTPRDYPGSLSRTPVFLGCSDQDPHIPLDRVEDTARVFVEMGGSVDKRIYPGLGHTVNDDEIEAVRCLVASADRGVASP